MKEVRKAVKFEVCLLQFMHRKGGFDGVDFRKESFDGALDDFKERSFDGALDDLEEPLWTSECRGTPFVASADPGHCSRAGAEMVLNYGDESASW